MTISAFRSDTPGAAAESAVRDLYEQVLNAWNRHSASEFAAGFSDDAHLVGFDGSQYNGRAEIEAEIGRIFADHVTAGYVWKIRQVRLLAAGVAILRAVVGMVPPEKSDLNPAVNAIQTLVAARHGDIWRIELLQNTPAQFHGRPQLALQLTDELRELLRGRHRA